MMELEIDTDKVTKKRVEGIEMKSESVGNKFIELLSWGMAYHHSGISLEEREITE
jgi:replicative superfamily II helicase